MEQFKNFMQIMIWMHNRLDINGLTTIGFDFDKASSNSLITLEELEILRNTRVLYEFDCQAQLIKNKEAVNASMA